MAILYTPVERDLYVYDFKLCMPPVPSRPSWRHYVFALFVCVCVRPSQRMQSPIRLPSTCKFQLVNLQTFSSDGRTGPPIYATAPMVGGLARSRLVVLTRRSLCIQDTAQLVTSTMQFCMLGTMGHPPGHFPPPLPQPYSRYPEHLPLEPEYPTLGIVELCDYARA